MESIAFSERYSPNAPIEKLLATLVSISFGLTRLLSWSCPAKVPDCGTVNVFRIQSLMKAVELEKKKIGLPSGQKAYKEVP
jgi:hypothetical protein